jgi:hypothetical protein
MTAIIILHDLVGTVVDDAGKPTRYQFPCYLKSFNPDAFDGGGSADATQDRAEAMRFADRNAALTFALQPSKVRPRRADGKLNRPLMVFTMEIVEV